MKMIAKSLFFLPMLVCAADTLKVLEGDVTVQINGATKTLVKDKQLKLEECDNVTFIHGKGKIKIKNLVFSEDTAQKTFKTICSENYFSSLAGKMFASSEASKYGVSLRGFPTLETNNEFNVTKPVSGSTIIQKDFSITNNYLLIESKRFYPLPIKLEIFNRRNESVYSETIDDKFQTAFKIDTSILEPKYTIRLKRVETDEMLLKININ